MIRGEVPAPAGLGRGGPPKEQARDRLLNTVRQGDPALVAELGELAPLDVDLVAIVAPLERGAIWVGDLKRGEVHPIEGDAVCAIGRGAQGVGDGHGRGSCVEVWMKMKRHVRWLKWQIGGVLSLG
jgi:hypothetical protein